MTMIAGLHLLLYVFPPHVVPPETWIDQVADWVLVVGCLLMILFNFVYGIGFKWWKRRAGRAIFSLFTSVTLLFADSVYTRLMGGDFPERDLLKLIIYVALPVSMFYMFYALLRNWLFGPTVNIEVESKVRPRAPRLTSANDCLADDLEKTTPTQPGRVVTNLPSMKRRSTYRDK